MFEVYNEIEKAPNLILSAQRKYLFRFNATVAINSEVLAVKTGDKICVLVYK